MEISYVLGVILERIGLLERTMGDAVARCIE